ncbi:serine/threonine protein kinase [Pleurocapsales cyanobacterium LEGE 06147]|nr:serine/threonine protein kinase [Pleurocapsales cyanobacterium LEGE 06147]
MAKSSALLRDGTILNDRYRIIRQIGRGGFGRTYLAEDTHRYREKCVLKEFAPQVESDRDLRKAEELFEREAGILYQLKHEQIPKFEALLRTRVDGKECLFLVQEYIDGYTYWELLQRRGKFSEKEVIQLLVELLPVLEYIHSQNLIHRDISPDNLIRRNTDGKPILIDFGCVKVAANAVSKSTGQWITLIGKKGYAPEEQMRKGLAFASSDLYSLAVTVIVLLTDKQPDELYDSHRGDWRWQQEIRVSSHLAKILDTMLAYNPRDRYPTAQKVRQALEAEHDSFVGSIISHIRTLVVAPGDLAERVLPHRKKTQNNSIPSSSQVISRLHSNLSRITTKALTLSRKVTHFTSVNKRKKSSIWQFVLISTGVLVIPGILAFTVTKGLLFAPNYFPFNPLSGDSLSQTEQHRQKEIYERIQALNIDPAVFYERVDRLFYEQYPQLKGIQLTDKEEHLRYREIWYEIANRLLERQ